MLQPLSWLYRGGAALQRVIDTRLRTPQRASRPLVVVGNLVAGGAGKTPTVIALVALLREMGWRPGVISRGYGRRDDDRVRIVDAHSDAAEVGDEPLLIRLRTRAPVAVARRRIDAARLLCERQPEVTLLVADDGLQHHALARDAQVIVFDERGAGNGLLLPAGPLREPLPTELPARTLVVYNAAQPSTPLPGTLALRALPGPIELARWWHGEAPGAVDWSALRGRRIFACAGTAVPERFFAMLRQQGLDLVPIVLPDHAPYTHLPWPADAADVVLTEKDAVKLRPERTGHTRVWVAPLDLQLDASLGPALARWLPAPR